MLFVQSEGTAARRRFLCYLVDATDGISAETGEAGGQPQISKNGGSWANTTATLTAVGNGGYYVELTATELDTAGNIAVRYKSANTAEFNMPADVVAFTMHDAVPAVDVTHWLGTAVATPTVAGVPEVDVTHYAGSASIPAVVGGRYDVSVGAMQANVLTAAATAADFSTEVNAAVLAVLGALADAAADGDPTSADTVMAYVKQLVNTLVGTAGVVTFPASAVPANAVSLAEAIRQIYDEVAGVNGITPPAAAAVTTLQTDVDDIQARLPAALVGGRMDSSVGAMANDVITAAATAADFSTETNAAVLAAMPAAAPSAATVADAVWDETLSGHLAAGSTGEALNAAGAAGDPWTTALPGAYGAGSAGAIIGNLDDAVAAVQADTDNIQTRLPATLVGGRIDSSVGAMAADVITAAATATDFSTEVNAAVLAVLGALNVTAASGDPGTTTTIVAYLKQLVNTLSGTAGLPTFPASAAPANAVSLAEAIRQIYDEVAGLNGGALPAAAPTAAAIADAVWDEPNLDHITALSTGSSLFSTVDTVTSLPDAPTIADAVWNETLSGHLAAGSTGEALNGAGAAGDPWLTALPGAYGAGSAGAILGTNLDATVSSRATPAQAADAVWDEPINLHTGVANSAGLNIFEIYDDVNTYIPNSIAAVQADTDNIQTRLPAVLVSGRMDSSIGAVAAGAIGAAAFAAGALDAVWSVTTRLLSAGTNIVLAKGTGVTGFNDVSTAQVNAEVLDVLNTDTFAEPAQGTPAATASLVTKIGFLYKFLRNRVTSTATTISVYDDAAATVDHKATHSDNGTVYDRGEFGSGP